MYLRMEMQQRELDWTKLGHYRIIEEKGRMK
jgi:hypothetical protein